MTPLPSGRSEPGSGPDADRLLADWLVDEAPAHEPPVLLDATLARTALTRRKPGWLVADRWLWPPIGRPGGLWRTHPMLTTLTALAVVSGASLLLVSSLDHGADPGLLGAGSGTTLVVAHDDGADFTSLIAAVGEAEDGDTIVLRPGHYIEWVSIRDKDISIVGEGDPSDVVVQSGYDNTFHVSNAALTLSNLTVVGQEYGYAIEVVGEAASATLDGVDLQVAGSWCCEHSPIRWTDGATGVLRDSTVQGKVEVLSGASATIEDSVLSGACVEVGARAHLVVRGSVITGCPLGYGIALRGGSAIIEDNDLSVPASDITPSFGTREDGVALRVGAGGAVAVRDNVIHGSPIGLALAGSSPTLEGNVISGNDIGVRSSTELTLDPGNRVCDNGTDLVVLGVPATGESEACGEAMLVNEG